MRFLLLTLLILVPVAVFAEGRNDPILNGSANSAVGNTPNEIPAPCIAYVIRIVLIAPKAIVSLWAKLENLKIP